MTVQRAMGGHGERLRSNVRVSCAETVTVRVLAPGFLTLQITAWKSGSSWRRTGCR